MNYENAKAYLPYVRAMAEEKKIQIRENDSAAWKDVEPHQHVRLEEFDPRTEVRIKPEAKRVSLGPQDVPPGSAVTWPGCTRGRWEAVISVSDLGIYLGCGRALDYGTLSSECWLISRDGGKTWQPCSKEVEE